MFFEAKCDKLKLKPYNKTVYWDAFDTGKDFAHLSQRAARLLRARRQRSEEDAPVEHGAKISPRFACVMGSVASQKWNSGVEPNAVFVQSQEDGVF
ncbi:hypothetical protein CE91St46_16220 [Eubacteriales bacterium]|nr:hypothetical protein CE91St46_16220 [Eubacteriales bacterium]GKH63233.1 hypothetical protein CE91St47_17020 [Eubacteriales bacterium]